MSWFWKIKNIPVNVKFEDRNIHSIKVNTWKLLFSYFVLEMNEHSYNYTLWMIRTKPLMKSTLMMRILLETVMNKFCFHSDSFLQWCWASLLLKVIDREISNEILLYDYGMVMSFFQERDISRGLIWNLIPQELFRSSNLRSYQRLLFWLQRKSKIDEKMQLDIKAYNTIPYWRNLPVF